MMQVGIRAGRYGFGVCVCLWAGGAVAETTVELSEPRSIESEVRLVPTRAYTPALASSGTGLLSVYRTDEAVMARRLDGEGTPVGLPIVVSSGATTVGAAVTFDGERFVASWVEWVSEGVYQIKARRLAENGALLGTEDTLAVTQEAPVLGSAAGGGSAVVAYCTSASGSCWASLIDGASTSTALPLAETGGPVNDLAVAFSSDHWLAVMSSGVGDYSALRFDTDGAIDQEPFVLGTDTLSNARPGVAGTDAGFTVTWLEDVGLRVTSIAADGSKSDRLAALPIDGDYLIEARLEATPSGFALLTIEPDGCCEDLAMLYRVSPDWEMQGDRLFVDLQVSGQAALVAHGSDVVAAWNTDFGPVVTATAAPKEWFVERKVISIGAPHQGSAIAAPGPGGWAVLWYEAEEIRGQRLDHHGHPISGSVSFCRNDNSLVTAGVWLNALAGGPSGWLAVLKCPGEGIVTSYFDAEGVVHQPVPLPGAWGAFSVVEMEDGWLVATSDMWDPDTQQSGMAVTRFNVMGEQQGTQWVSGPPLKPVQGSDLTRVPDGFRAWWGDGGKILSKRLSATGEVVPGEAELVHTTANLSSFFVATAGSRSSLWWDDLSGTHFSYLPVSTAQPAPSRYTGMSLVGVRGVIALAANQPGPQEPYASSLAEILIAEPDGPLEVKATVPATLGAALSEAADDRLLLTFARNETLFGSTRMRLTSAVAQVNRGAIGGAGGVDAGGESAAAGMTSIAGTPTSEGGAPGSAGAGEPTSAGAGATGGVVAEGGVAQGGASGSPDEFAGAANAGNGDSAMGAAHNSPRTSSGCGCRVARGNHYSSALAFGIGLILLRRRGTHRRRRGRRAAIAARL